MSDSIQKDDKRFEELMALQCSAGVFPEVEAQQKKMTIEEKYEMKFVLEEILKQSNCFSDFIL